MRQCHTENMIDDFRDDVDTLEIRTKVDTLALLAYAGRVNLVCDCLLAS
jgi:hypothetical protein